MTFIRISKVLGLAAIALTISTAQAAKKHKATAAKETTTTETAPIGTETYNIDVAHSKVTFTIDHLLSEVEGSFKDFSGTIQTDKLTETKETIDVDGAPKEITRKSFTKIGKAKVTIDVATIDTDNPDRDAHLKNPDFFDIENKEHPEYAKMTFETDELVSITGKAPKITGKLTLHGVTKEVTLDLKFKKTTLAEDGWGNKSLGFVGTTTIDRKDFGLKFTKLAGTGEMLVGDKVTIKVSIAANLQTEKKA